ncbi:hypothetical protein KMU_33690 [Proteus vulgaris]|uniref:hypothetical protein n=1 Tax=Proteus vulgaris TaxID=585 RepID=UPI002553859D|nr:hypothetical protein [Proteus vulgaris]GLX65327.1 hypothetical protein KMU_33690 [Proteus vulgaris]
MSFSDFFSKATKLAGKAIVAVASEVINQGPSTITKNYLEKASELRLTSSQQNLVERAKVLNQRFSFEKRDISDLSGKIKENKEKSSSIDTELENKALSIWNMTSGLITKDGLFQLNKYQKTLFIVFNTDDKNKIPLLEMINNLPKTNKKIDLIEFKKDFLTHFNNEIPCEQIDNINDELASSILASLNDFHLFEEQSIKILDELSKELNELENSLDNKKERVAEIDSELKPLLNEVRSFCDPLFKERKEITAKNR